MTDFQNVPATATGVIHIDLGQLAANWQALAKFVMPARCSGVVKANAYGLGLDRVVPALMKAGCQTFFVATIDEAKDVRALASDAAIFVLDGLLPGAEKALTDINAIPVLSSLEEFQDWSAHARKCNKALPTAMHIDTGLNRLGMTAVDIRELAAGRTLLEKLNVYLIMSHLACADDPDDDMNARQLNVFEGLLPLLPTVATSLAASDGLMLGAPYHTQLVRPGYALYGGQATKEPTAPVKPVVKVHARVLQVSEIVTGQTIGYSAIYKATSPRRIATVAAGYADGVLRTSSAASGEAGGFVAFNGRLAPIVGRVSMDLITVDITELDDETIHRGSWTELVGPTISLEDAGHGAKTIGYEILTSLSKRFHRIYTGEDTITR
ncbi:MAG: alanine racemase [Hyphomicrobiaceae bacterium]